MLRDVIEAHALSDYRLELTFDDGTAGEVDVSELVEFTGVFEPLRDRAEFAKVRVDPDLGTVCWPNGADLDPLVLYSKVTGKPTSFEKPALV
jgi:hypothetical protein